MTDGLEREDGMGEPKGKKTTLNQKETNADNKNCITINDAK